MEVLKRFVLLIIIFHIPAYGWSQNYYNFKYFEEIIKEQSICTQINDTRKRELYYDSITGNEVLKITEKKDSYNYQIEYIDLLIVDTFNFFLDTLLLLGNNKYVQIANEIPDLEVMCNKETYFLNGIGIQNDNLVLKFNNNFNGHYYTYYFNVFSNKITLLQKKEGIN